VLDAFHAEKDSLNEQESRVLSQPLCWRLVCNRCAVAGAAEEAPAPTITGAGEAFTWVLLDQIRPQLERDHHLKLSLYGKDSMLGHGCNVGIKKARENRVGNETFVLSAARSPRKRSRKRADVHPVALEPLIIIVHKSNPVQDIPIEKVRAIFRGEIRNWKEVGGETGRL